MISATPVLGSLPTVPAASPKSKNSAMPASRFAAVEPTDRQVEPTPIQVMGGPTIRVLDDFTNSSSFDPIEPTSSVDGTPSLPDDLFGPNSFPDYEDHAGKVRRVFFVLHFLWLGETDSDRISQSS